MLEKYKKIFSIPEVRNSLLFILLILVIFRFAANVPLPGVDVERLRALVESTELVGFLNIFSGGGLANISVVLLGLGPYITASIIMQLMTMVVPRVEQLYREEGEQGRAKFNMITRVLTVPLAIAQTIGMITLLRSQGIMGALSTFEMVVIVTSAVAGTIFLMWLGEMITERKLGNGVSIMIFAGIVASVPGLVSQIWSSFSAENVVTYLIFAAITVITIVGVVFISEGQRIIPVSYARRARGGATAQSHLPLRVNQAGVIPIIFAISLVLFPQLIGQALSQSANAGWAAFGTDLANLFSNQLFYGVLYFSLVVLFTYFYTAIIFDPKKIAENLQRQGGYIEGIRPGTETREYLGRVVNRITLCGALFLGLIAILPIVVQNTITNSQFLTVGGASILIVVSVVIELVKNIDSQIAAHEYE